MNTARLMVFSLGVALIATAVGLHVALGNRTGDRAIWNGIVQSALFGFGVTCVVVSTQGVE